MTETLFEIASYNKPLYRNSIQASNSYHNLLQNFCNTSYALYTEYFIKQIARDAQQFHHNIYKFCMKKNLRKCVKKFMLTDLQLIFLAHYCKINVWKFDSKQLIAQSNRNKDSNDQQSQQKCLELFLDLNAYFVKYYVGNQKQFQAIDNYLAQSFPKFTQIYQNWVLNKPKQSFLISPKKINELYRQYSRSIQQQVNKKDYNDLVDTLIDLSTTYSIMPYKKIQKKPTNQPQLVQRKIENNQLNYRNMRNRKSSIFKIAQNQQKMEQSDIPRFNSDQMVHGKKSSVLFQSLQPFHRKSEQLLQAQTFSNVKQEIPAKKQRSPSPQRSRQKKPPNKISLSFKRKQKPNQTVLGFIKQPSILQPYQQQKNIRGDNRSILNNMSFINLRSNRSSKTNSQIPFLWRPSEDNFFQKSKFG